MTLDRERLATIDEELAAFGKPDALLDGVRERARQLVAELSDVDAALRQLGVDPELATTKFDAVERIKRTSDIAGLTVDELFADAVTANDEGTMVQTGTQVPSILIPFTEATINDLFAADRLAGETKFNISRTWQHRDRLLGGSS